MRCPASSGSLYPVEWYYLNTNESIPTQKRNRIFVSRDRLKFLPARVEDSGIYACIIRRYCAGNHYQPCACSFFINDWQPSCPCFLSALPLSGMVKSIKWFEQESTPEKTSSLTDDELLNIPQPGHIYVYNLIRKRPGFSSDPRTMNNHWLLSGSKNKLT